jgi:hypothetical protein
MRQLRTATTADEIIDVLANWVVPGAVGLMTSRTWPHPDQHIRDTLESILRVYRGSEARRLHERLRSNGATRSGPDNG